MKKGKLLAASLLVLLTMTGCGGKKLTCTNEIESAGFKMKMTVNTSFKSDKLNSMEMVVDYELPDSMKDQKKELMESAKKELDGIENAKVTETKKGFKMTGKAKKSELGVDEDTKYDDVKKTLEKNGFKCK